MKPLVGSIILLLLTTNLLAAEREPIRSAQCTFTDTTNNHFDDGKLSWEVNRSTTEVMEVTFDQLDSDDGQGRMIASNGNADVQVINGAFSMTLIEITGLGGVNMTSLHIGNGYAHSRKVQAVFSRHPAIPTALLPSQRVGTCIVHTL